MLLSQVDNGIWRWMETGDYQSEGEWRVVVWGYDCPTGKPLDSYRRTAVQRWTLGVTRSEGRARRIPGHCVVRRFDDVLRKKAAHTLAFSNIITSWHTQSTESKCAVAITVVVHLATNMSSPQSRNTTLGHACSRGALCVLPRSCLLITRLWLCIP
jgi:hypothetical protein